MEEPRPKRPKPTPSRITEDPRYVPLHELFAQQGKGKWAVPPSPPPPPASPPPPLEQQLAAPETDTVSALRDREIKKLKDENDGMHANHILKDEIIKNMAEEIKELKDRLKAAARTISGEQVIIEEFQKRIERMLERDQNRFLLMMEDRGRLIRCLGVRSPHTVVDPAGAE